MLTGAWGVHAAKPTNYPRGIRLTGETWGLPMIIDTTKTFATAALTEAMALAWRLIYGGQGVIDAWLVDQGAIESRPLGHWCVQRLLGLSAVAVSAGERLERMVERIAGQLGINMLDVLTPRVDARLGYQAVT